MTETLKASKLYLKGDFKVHISNSSQVADHCSVFALSDSSDPDYRQHCDHSHEKTCDMCFGLDATLTEIEHAVNEAIFPTAADKDEAIYQMKSAKLAILAWKRHILRSHNQDQARYDVLDQLDEETVLIINDWAMKFLPQKYRESQVDWFAKRGISWHISVVYRRVNGLLEWQGFIHVIQSCSQGSPEVVAIMQDVLKTLKLQHGEITKAYFRQDNAGCYHSSCTILACPAIAESTGVQVIGIDFSDPQGGKGAADRLAAKCKGHVRIYINEGNDVCTGSQFQEALLSHGGIEGVRVVAIDSMEDLVIDDARKIPGISKLNNFKFNPESITAWRAYGIGRGKDIRLEKQSSECSYRWMGSTFSAGGFKSLSKKQPTHTGSETTEKPEVSKTQEEISSDETAAFACPQDGCVRVFQRHSSLEKHLSSEKCTKSLEKRSLLDLAKITYKSALEEGVGTIPTLQPVPGSESRTDFCNKEGWALKSTKKAYRFSEKQKEYLDAKFNIGQTSGRKLDGEVVAREMRRAQGPDGARIFNVAEFLSPQQISSYFSRLAAKVRKQLPDDCDVQASEEEINFTMARNLALETISLQHPIVFDQFDICTMVKNDTLKKLKLGMLQSICQNLELNVPVPAIRRKAPYLALLVEAVSQCTCQIRQ